MENKKNRSRTSLRLPIAIAGIFAIVVATGLVTLRTGRTADRPHWNVEFIPDEVNSVSVNINNEAWTTWQSSQGRVRWYLPDKWANLNKIHVYAAANPRGKNAHIRVFWDDTERQNMEFDNDEDHDVGRP
ncbi:MAG TPA: hypothetical protein VE863_10765 [Pyrinomonadaceae bacterium]|jgi:hypothetical protein|nr:hypothetical protein [Pyrinomonadaceae bacterium]